MFVESSGLIGRVNGQTSSPATRFGSTRMIGARRPRAAHPRHTCIRLLPTFRIRSLRSDRLSRFEVRASLLDSGTNQEISEPKDLRWEKIETDFADVTVEWADTAAPDYVERHPIGPQESAKTILQRLRSGSSVAVIAPRRFGKSTLVDALVREGRAFDLAIPPALWCTAFASSGGFDYERLWNEASSGLSKLLGAPLGMGRTGFLPDGDAFDHVRRSAAEKGYKAVVLLFDEAQLFFPSQTSAEISSTIKMLLERDWAKSNKRNGSAPARLFRAAIDAPAHRR